MVKLVDTSDLGSEAFKHVGSSPILSIQKGLTTDIINSSRWGSWAQREMDPR